MGEVYRADDLKLGQPVALKFLPPAFGQDPARLDRFYAEIRVARQVSHPNVCRVYDVGDIPGEHSLSMEFVDGEDLASLLRRIGRLPGDKALEIARQLCAGLAAAHDKGVLHRDLKPENVMLDGRGKVRITDFGLASLAEQVAGNDVRSGTPAYMSPEQLTGREVSVWSDVYALGLVLYELFTGKRAFEGKTFVELLRKHENEAPVSPSQLVSDLDPGVESVILRCLEKDPRRRPASALAVAAALPGGDPLAAALAAGETPSPELVAAARQGEGLAPRVAFALFAFALAGALAFVVYAGSRLLLGKVPFDKPPLVLADRARELIAAFGYGEVPADSAYGFGMDFDFVTWHAARDRSATRWRILRTGQPPVIQLWYRQSPQLLVSTSVGGRVFSANPPLTVSGMSGVRLDMSGRLIEFYAVPAQLEKPDQAPSRPADWARLFAEARLELAAFTPVASTWTPLMYADARAAWTGVLPEHPDIEIRVEAASYRGRPVWFQIIQPWTRASRMQPYQPRSGQLIASTVVGLLLLGGMLASGLLARRNLRLGRVDRRGATAVAGFSLLGGLVVWALGADHVPEFNLELSLFMRGLALSLLNACSTGLLYAALEPYVRRLWPHALTSWTRLLAGRWQDPLVGAHVLMGVVYGVALLLAMIAVNTATQAAGVPPDFPPAFGLDALLGPDQAFMFELDRLVDSVTMGMGAVLLFVGLRYLLRPWLAMLVGAVIIGLPDAFSSATAPWIAVPAATLLMSFFVVALMREGLLTLVVTLFVTGLISNVPLSLELSKWYSMPAKLALAVLVLLAGYALRAALVRDRAPLQ
jgi:serine/threonine-protein kinase